MEKVRAKKREAEKRVLLRKFLKDKVAESADEGKAGLEELDDLALNLVVDRPREELAKCGLGGKSLTKL